MKHDRRFEKVACRCCSPARMIERHNMAAHEQAVRAKRGAIEERRVAARSARGEREQGGHHRRPRHYGAPMTRW